MNPHSFFDLSLWCIRFYFIIRFSLSNTPFSGAFLLFLPRGGLEKIRARAKSPKPYREDPFRGFGIASDPYLMAHPEFL